MITKDGVELINEERARQLGMGFDEENDAYYTHSELSLAARAYLSAAIDQQHGDDVVAPPVYWPWDNKYWKPETTVKGNLAKAGALIAAEIDRITAAEHRTSEEEE